MKPKRRKKKPYPAPTSERPRGRPLEYDPAYCAQAGRLVRLGLTDAEIAQFFEVAPVTIWRWKDTFPDFCSAIARSKDEVDDLVEQSLYKRAVGFSQDAVKVFMPAGAPEPVYAPYVEHIPPEVNAARLWLTNRRPGTWRDKIVHSNDPDAPIVPVLNVIVESKA